MVIASKNETSRLFPLLLDVQMLCFEVTVGQINVRQADRLQACFVPLPPSAAAAKVASTPLHDLRAAYLSTPAKPVSVRCSHV